MFLTNLYMHACMYFAVEYAYKASYRVAIETQALA